MLDTKDVTIVVMGGLLKMRLEGLAFNGVSFVTLEMFVCLIHTLWWIRVCIWMTILWAYHNGWTIHSIRRPLVIRGLKVAQREANPKMLNDPRLYLF